jgi:tetratricopeptide (TPR) repeat protein
VLGIRQTISGTALLVALIATSGHAQRTAESGAAAAGVAKVGPDSASLPARPDRGLGADTNNAQGFFEYGMQVVERRPAVAARAFYWASRLDPSSGDALYALHSATILAMSDKELLKYLHSDKGKRAPNYVAFDSMQYRAYAMDPFVFASLDPTVLRRIIETQIHDEHPHATSAEIGMSVFTIMGGDANWAWMQYSRNELPRALATYAKVLADTSMPRHAKARDSAAITRHRKALAPEFHAQRARIFYRLGEMDSAETEMSTALDGMRTHDDSTPVFFYRSKAMYEQSLGMIYQRANKIDKAREAYGRALEEDLAFYSAHCHLAQLDLARSDTTDALTEMDLAIQLSSSDPALRYQYAELLVHAKRDGDAAVQLRKAIELDPYYGAPHLLLALIADVEKYTDDAVREYSSYVAVASRTDEHLRIAQARLKELTASVASNPVKP